jgi:hypothetical protein
VDPGPARRIAEVKKPLEEIYEDLNFASDRISSQVRTLTFGVLALVWLFLSGNKDAPILKIGSHSPLVIIAGLCIATLLVDAIQYWAMYRSARKVLQDADNHNRKEAEYDDRSFMRIIQQDCFWAKQLLAVIAAIWLIVLIFVSVA